MQREYLKNESPEMAILAEFEYNRRICHTHEKELQGVYVTMFGVTKQLNQYQAAGARVFRLVHDAINGKIQHDEEFFKSVSWAFFKYEYAWGIVDVSNYPKNFFG